MIRDKINIPPHTPHIDTGHWSQSVPDDDDWENTEVLDDVSDHSAGVVAVRGVHMFTPLRSDHNWGGAGSGVTQPGDSSTPPDTDHICWSTLEKIYESLVTTNMNYMIFWSFVKNLYNNIGPWGWLVGLIWIGPFMRDANKK